MKSGLCLGAEWAIVPPKTRRSINQTSHQMEVIKLRSRVDWETRYAQVVGS